MIFIDKFNWFLDFLIKKGVLDIIQKDLKIYAPFVGYMVPQRTYTYIMGKPPGKWIFSAVKRKKNTFCIIIISYPKRISFCMTLSMF